MNKSEILDSIKHGLIVSCQARKGWAMYGCDIMAAFAKAAQEGGAVGIRATGADNIAKIKRSVKLPIIGINKQWINGCNVYITPTYQSAEEILRAGVEIIALDATQRERPNKETYWQIQQKIREQYPDVCIMGEIATIEEARQLIDMKPDLISTTLSGYTDESKNITSVNLELIQQIRKLTDIPIIAEGKIRSEEEALAALQAGAFAVVVGTSITRPEIITSRYVEKLRKVY